MSLDFPDSPSLNDTYTASGTTWRWDGSAWNVVPTTEAFISVAGSQTLSNKSLGSDLEASGNTVTGLKTPSAGTDAATKSYVDAATAVPQIIDGGNAGTSQFTDSLTGGAA